MKKFKFSSRLLSFALAFVMLVSMVPMTALAAVNDIVTGTNAGDTGIVNSTAGEDGTINWPVKIYDYLADGMLFNFAESNATSIDPDDLTSASGGAALYGGGEPMVVTKYGSDYTADGTYSKKAYNTSYNRSSNYTRSRRAAVSGTSPQYVRLTRSGTTGYANFCVADFYNDYSTSGIAKDEIRYIAVVFRSYGLTSSTTTPAFHMNTNFNAVDNWGQAKYMGDMSKFANTNGWTYMIIDLAESYDNYQSTNRWANNVSTAMKIFFRFNMDSSSDYFDLSHVAFFSNEFEAEQYAIDALAFVKNPGEHFEDTGERWIMGNNKGFGMLYNASGEAWGSNSYGTTGRATYANSYKTYRMGYTNPTYQSTGTNYNSYRYDINGNLLDNSTNNNHIYFITGTYATSDGYKNKLANDNDPTNDEDYLNGYDTSEINFDGYQLLTHATKGVMTMGLLEGELKNGRPQYRQETVEYIAELLYYSLAIPQCAYDTGNYFYNHLKGAENGEQYGYASGKALDLPQALRNCLGLTFSSSSNYGSGHTLGNYATTEAKGSKLIGAFLDCKSNITTCMDAAYYLLNNLFVDNSYNQLQDDYKYLTLSSATLDTGETAFVFDAAFANGGSMTDLESGKITQDEYKAASQSAVEYSPLGEGGSGTISLGPVQAKDLYYFQGTASTTRFPFLPVTDAEGVYAGETKSYYFVEDGYRSYTKDFGTYVNRNFNYALVTNGEFVYEASEGLYFEFEGDDDVYLFINDQLVMDLGAAHSISNVSFQVNDYVEWAKEVLDNKQDYTADEIERAEALYLEDGEVASFDFYYMERHGYGANMRIVTNMHVTDPDLRVQKRAYQGGTELDFGDIVNGIDPVEYSFDITNKGNVKLYNFTFEDNDIGVTLSPENGLFVKGDDSSDVADIINGYIVTDANGGTLDPEDLYAVVSGYKPVASGGNYRFDGDHNYTYVTDGSGTHEYVEVTVNFTSNEELKSFLHTLEAKGTDDSTIDDELTQSGAGLWVDATLSIKGIYYTLTKDQVEAGVFNNTVYVSATNKSNRNDPASEDLKSEDSHRVYMAALPYYYQWAENEVFITTDQILVDAAKEAGNEGSMLHDYQEFLDYVNGRSSLVDVSFCDKLGGYVDQDNYYKYVSFDSNSSGVKGVRADYDEPGTHEFYLFMRLKSASETVENAGLNINDPGSYNLSEYAIVRVIVFVTKVEDSTYVLDYGLRTENLDVNGEMFKNDELFGADKNTKAKLMGVTTEQPDYLSVDDGTADYNYIDFNAADLDENNKLSVKGDDGKTDGYYVANLSIPAAGKDISYNAYSGYYSLTESGTVTVHLETPYKWEEAYVYFWYDNGINNGWRGDLMEMHSHGNFSQAIPGNAPHIIISIHTEVENEEGVMEEVWYQTEDLNINTGEDVWVELPGTINSNGKIDANVTYKTADGVIHASVPEGWGDVYLYMWDAYGNGLTEWPGTQIETVDNNGYYTVTIPGDITNVIINNGNNGKQTKDLTVNAGQESWINVTSAVIETNDVGDIDYHGATVTRTLETVTMHAQVPEDWDEAWIYYYNGNGSSTGVPWPGYQMTLDEDGWYTRDGLPADITNVVINNGNSGKQTEDIEISPGLETWFTVQDLETGTTVEATVPDNWNAVYFYFFANGEAVGAEWPGTQITETNSAGAYIADVPADADHVIVHNGSGTQSQDMLLTPGIANVYEVSDTGLITTPTTLRIYLKGTWDHNGDGATDPVYVHSWKSVDATGTTWPGDLATYDDELQCYVIEFAGERDRFIINNGSGKQTGDLSYFYNSAVNNIDLWDDIDGTDSHGFVINHTGTVITLNDCYVSYGEESTGEGFYFVPTDFMDSEYSVWMALTVHETDINPSALGSINIGKEVQMFKKVTVLPANVVYYEDDFLGIKYNENTSNVISHWGSGSGSLSQSVNQNQQYGNDVVYQGSGNDEETGGSLTDADLKELMDNIATFEFTGTGFEIIGHTHAWDACTINVEVFDENGNLVDQRVAITEYDNGDDIGGDSIVSIPVVRINGLTFGKYTVKISGIATIDWSGGYTGDPHTMPLLKSVLCIDGVRVFQPLADVVTPPEDADDPQVSYSGTAAPFYYQWDENGVFMTENQIFAEAGKAAQDENHPLHKHLEFFENNNTSIIWTNFYDPVLSTTVTYDYVSSKTDANGDWGFFADYPMVGEHTFYLFMRSQEATTRVENAGLDKYNSANFEDHEYAIVPVTVITLAGTEITTSTNLALNGTYEAAEPTGTTWIGNLNDGVVNSGTVYETGYWHGFNSNQSTSNCNTDTNGQGYVTYDLGAKYSIESVKAHMLYRDDYGIGNTEYIEVYVSDDNVNYTFVGNMSFTASTTRNTTYWASLFKNTVGRYVRVVFGKATDNHAWVFTDEVQIFGTSYVPAETSNNVALGKDYTAEGYGDWDVCNLTDGVTAKTIDWDNRDANGNYKDWFGFHKTYNSAKGYGDVVLDLGGMYDMDTFKMHLYNNDTSLSIGAPSSVEVAVSADGANYTDLGTMTVNGDATAAYWAALSADAEGRYVRFRINNGKYSWVFLNEIQVYGERDTSYDEDYIPGANDAYLDTENGAQFYEVRNLIADRQAFVVGYTDTNGLSVSGGTTIWIENRNEFDPSDKTLAWSGNIVGSIEDYLLAGPNNEVYLLESNDTEQSAVAFYVTEVGSGAKTMQVGARAMDYAAFVGSSATGNIYTELQYGAVDENGLIVWRDLATMVSTAEQYYVIPYEECPYDAENDRYQVVLRVADTDITGMASLTSLKINGLALHELNSTEVPDVEYTDELGNTLVESNTGITVSTSKFVNFLALADQMKADEEEDDDTDEPEVPVFTSGADTSALGAIADSFTANNSYNFGITNNTSRIFIVSANTPSAEVLQTAQLAQSQFAEDGYVMDVVWGDEECIRSGDIAVYLDSSAGVGDEGYKLTVTDVAKVQVQDADGMLYGLNTLQKHFRLAGTNAIKGFTLTDAPDTKERIVHLDIARKYLTKDWICNYLREMSWMGYNAIELHMSEDGGFRSDIWNSETMQLDGMSGNDFSWALGSRKQTWAYSGGDDVDAGKYLTTEELIEICEVAKEYHISIIPSFDTPAHVDWITTTYAEQVAAGNTSIQNFTYNGTNYTLPTTIHYANGKTALNLANTAVKNLAYALYNDIAVFFKEYAGSTKFNIGGDELGLSTTSGFTYTDVYNYINAVNAVLNSRGYTSRVYNDFFYRNSTVNTTAAIYETDAELDDNIEVVIWTAEGTYTAPASDWVAQGRTIYGGINAWTYYVLRYFDHPNYSNLSNYPDWGKDARDPSNKWWTFYRNTEDSIYNEWMPGILNNYGSTEYKLTTDQLGGGYFMVWCDNATVNTEVEMWNGVWDRSTSANNGKYFYSLIDRMWSNAIKQWNWDINSSLDFADYENLRDEFGYFPGYDDEIKNSAGENIGCSTEVTLTKGVTGTEALVPEYTVKFVNYNGAVLSKQTVKKGEDAVAPEDPTRLGTRGFVYTFAGWDGDYTNITADTTITATYTAESNVENATGYLEVKVSGGTGFTMSVNDGEARTMATEYNSSYIEVSSKLTLTAETTNDNNFIAWFDAATGNILCEDETYTFYASGDDVIVALYDTDIEEMGTVVFKNDKTDQILDIQYYSANDTIAFPADPTYLGYDFAGWDHSESAIKAKLSAGEDVVVLATWRLQQVFFSVTVQGGYVLSHPEMNSQGEYLGYKAMTVKASEPAAGYKFSHWEDSDGNILSYDEEYKFYPTKDTELIAVCVTKGVSSIAINGTIKTEQESVTNPATYDIDKVGTIVDSEESTEPAYKVEWVDTIVDDTTDSETGDDTDTTEPTEPDDGSEDTATTFTVYFLNNWNWSDVCIYYWNDNDTTDATTNVAWSGVAMTLYDEGATDALSDNTYVFEVPVGVTGIIINGLKDDGSGNRDQTPDIKEFVDGRTYSMTWDGDNNRNGIVIDDSRVVSAAAAVASETASSTTKVYLEAGVDWDSAGAWFAAYSWNGSGNTWTKMTATTSEGIYVAEIPADHTNVIFCRMNSAMTTVDWTSVWNQTHDLTLTSGNNVFTVTDPWSSSDTGYWTGKLATIYFVNRFGWSNVAYQSSYVLSEGFYENNLEGYMTYVEDNEDGYGIYKALVRNDVDTIAFDESTNDYKYIYEVEGAVTNGAVFQLTENVIEETNKVYFLNDCDWTNVSLIYGDTTVEMKPYESSAYTDPVCVAEIPADVTTVTITNGTDSFTYTTEESLDGAVLSIVEVTPETTVTYNTVYMEASDNWTIDNAWFAAYVWNDGGDAWYEMSYLRDNTYVVNIPVEYSNVIFVRMNPSATEANWSGKMNQSADLTISGHGNYFVMSENWDAPTAALEHMNRIYFVNSNNWTDVYVSYTTADGSYSGPMTLYSGKTYYALVPDFAETITFYNNIDGGEELEYTIETALEDGTKFTVKTVSNTIDYEILTDAYIDTKTYGDRNAVVFSWDVNSLTGCTFVSAGVLLTDNTSYTENTLVVTNLNDDITRVAPANEYQTASGMYSVSLLNVASGDTWVARTYVRYRDADGILRTAYSDIITATK